MNTGDRVRPARLVHLAEKPVWVAAAGRATYIPREWDRDGFIHLSAIHQLLPWSAGSPSSAVVMIGDWRIWLR